MTETMTTERHVRVTLEGTVRTMGSDGGVLRVQYAPDATVLLLADRVQLEDVPAEHVWTDGDVVQSVAEGGRTGWTLTRHGGTWVSSHPGVPVGHWTDEKVSRHLVDRGNGWGHLTVLRHQAGAA